MKLEGTVIATDELSDSAEVIRSDDTGVVVSFSGGAHGVAVRIAPAAAANLLADLSRLYEVESAA